MPEPSSVFHNLLRYAAQEKASDVYLTTGASPSIRVMGVKQPVSAKRLAVGQTRELLYSVMSPDQISTLERTRELSFAYLAPDIGRFRISVYWQRGELSAVLRYIDNRVPSLKELGLPTAVADLAMLPRGLVLVVGSTGSGKSSTLAAMIQHRAQRQADHILTVEDPIEFHLKHLKATVDQREVGTDTLSFADALRASLRQAPDMIVIGEIRDRDTMQHAMNYAETGHLCVSTLHATNAAQTIKRVLNFYPETAHQQVLMDLSLNLGGVLAQRLVPALDGTRALAFELMTRSAFVAELIRKGAIDELRPAIAKSGEGGMQSFDQSLMDLVERGKVDADVALSLADSRTDFALKLRLNDARPT
jgi:twitching motility protein PilU